MHFEFEIDLKKLEKIRMIWAKSDQRALIRELVELYLHYIQSKNQERRNDERNNE
jgi:hypothetical protein